MWVLLRDTICTRARGVEHVFYVILLRYKPNVRKFSFLAPNELRPRFQVMIVSYLRLKIAWKSWRHGLCRRGVRNVSQQPNIHCLFLQNFSFSSKSEFKCKWDCYVLYLLGVMQFMTFFAIARICRKLNYVILSRVCNFTGHLLTYSQQSWT